MIHSVIGTRAQLIKMAPVLSTLRDRGLEYRLILTGQHQLTMREMLKDFDLREPDLVLWQGDDVTSVGQTARWLTRMLYAAIAERGELFGGDRKGIVLVHGDTFSTAVGALMGRLAGLRVAHVESGLRSFDLLNPFPEELTRLLTFRLSHVLMCPGAWAHLNVAKLGRETVDTGANTLVDTLAIARQSAESADHVPQGRFGVVSLHRYENIFNRTALERLIGHVERIARDHSLLFILHPPTERQLQRFGFHARLATNPAIELRPRYTYFRFAALLTRADFIVTDGGSVQEESSYLGLPCLLLRKATERQEGLGANVLLSGNEPETIEAFLADLDRFRQEPVGASVSPSSVIVDEIARYA